MVFIWGNKGYHDLLGYVIMKCPACATVGPFSVEQIRKKVTLYFIPTFNYSQKQYLVCKTCQATFEVKDDEKEDLASKIMSQNELSAFIRRANENKYDVGGNSHKNLPGPENRIE